MEVYEYPLQSRLVSHARYNCVRDDPVMPTWLGYKHWETALLLHLLFTYTRWKYKFLKSSEQICNK